jgi:hypothetical protein
MKQQDQAEKGTSAKPKKKVAEGDEHRLTNLHQGLAYFFPLPQFAKSYGVTRFRRHRPVAVPEENLVHCRLQTLVRVKNTGTRSTKAALYEAVRGLVAADNDELSY